MRPPSGAFSPKAARHLRRLARDARELDCDGTDYRNSGVGSFVAYYAQRITAACVMYGAEGILNGIRNITVRAHTSRRVSDAQRCREGPSAVPGRECVYVDS